MKRGDIKEVKVNGRAVLAEFLGKGMFCRAFREVGTDRVLCFTGEDLSKDILAWCDDMPHLPTVKRIDDSSDAGYIFEMPFYTMLKASHKEAWAQYLALKACWQEEYSNLRRERKPFSAVAYKMNHAIAEKAPVSEELKAALLELADTAQEWGEEFAFEFAPRNLAVDASGSLILMDVVFNSKALK